MRAVLLPWLALFTLTLGGASHSGEAGHAPAGPADWLAWQAARRVSVAGTNGWTTLVGLHWLKEGANFAGNDPTNQVVLPRRRGADAVACFTRTGGGVVFEAAPGIEVRADGQPVRLTSLRSDTPGPATRLEVGALSITLLARGERLALRVRDPDAPTRREFRGLEYFIIFQDLTAGVSTYPGGRFLRVPKPDAAGRLIVDFNRACNPPCAFAPFATCPLPPPQNSLPFAVPASERNAHRPE